MVPWVARAASAVLDILRSRLAQHRLELVERVAFGETLLSGVDGGGGVAATATLFALRVLMVLEVEGGVEVLPRRSAANDASSLLL